MGTDDGAVAGGVTEPVTAAELTDCCAGGIPANISSGPSVSSTEDVGDDAVDTVVSVGTTIVRSRRDLVVFLVD